MAIDRLANLPAGTDVFLDANIFIYSFAGQSNECRDLLRRFATENVFGITTLEVINEVTHRLMLAEAVAKGIITSPYGAKGMGEGGILPVAPPLCTGVFAATGVRVQNAR